MGPRLELVCAIAGLVGAASSASAAATPPAPAPHKLHLSFADGLPTPAAGICQGRPAPPFRRNSFDRDGRRHALQRAVQRLYAGLNLEVTLQPPAEPHLTIVITSEDGGWCKPDYRGEVRGIAPINCAGDGRWGLTGYVFSCDDVGRCATRIAQESAHLLGLDHTSSPSDVMYPRETDGRARFLNASSKTTNPFCGRVTQNSHALLASRLGASRSRDPNRKERQ